MIIHKKPPRNSQGFYSWLRGNSPFIVITFVFLGTVAGFFYTIDRFYIEEKWKLVQNKIENHSYFKRVNLLETTPRVRTYVETVLGWKNERNIDKIYEAKRRATERGPELKENLREEFRNILHASPVITSLKIQEVNGETLIYEEDLTKLSRQHNLWNSLISRNFRKSAKQSINMPFGDREETVATWIISFTTQRNDPDIQALTAQYWRMLLFTFGILTLGYYILLKFTFQPIRRVILFMERRDERRSYLIPNPTNMLERAYNNLARDAAITRLSKELRDQISKQGLSYAEPILEQLPRILDSILSIPTIQLWTFHREDGRWIPNNCHSLDIAYPNSERFPDEFRSEVLADPPDQNPARWRALFRYQKTTDGRSFPYYCDVLDVRDEHLWMMTIHPNRENASPTDWWLEYFRRISNELRYALSSVEDQRRLILQEKSKANISLSRNLGHDLTNIIATSKLELMTVRSLLAKGPDTLNSSETKKRIFEESLEALLDNTRFLQEIVNLYRSFSYLQKPKFEEVELSELVHNVADLYSLTLSTAFKIEVHEEGEIPRLIVEPRLLRLALFNLLTNSVDAIKRSGGEEKPEGCITVSTRHLPEKKIVEISVADTGPGIRDSSGNLMSAETLSEIFRLGFTTKQNQEGEGLGLNWVQSIVREFHGGEVTARNRPEGGAMFIIRIPEVRPSAKVSLAMENHQLLETAGVETS